MARDNLFISLFGMLAPHTGFIQVVGFRKHSRELHRIVGIVGNRGEAAKPCDRDIALAEFIFNLGQMAFGSSPSTICTASTMLVTTQA